jgi:putative heme-binding domain-containing protein
MLMAPTPAFSGVPVPLTGWEIKLVAEAPVIRHPSVVCVAPDGRVFVAEDPMDISTKKASEQLGRIICLFPDGRMTVFAENLHAVFGMQYLEGRLYVLHNPKFSVFRDVDGVGQDRVELIEQTNPEPWALDWNDHVPANFRLAMDGYFYLAVGDKGLYGAVDRAGQRIDLHGGGVVRIRPNGTGLEIIARGVRNILDVAIDAEDELFTYDNTDEHQWMGRVTHMVDGGFYGYPFDFIPRRPYTLWMLADYGPGAACGALVYNDDALPEAYRGNLFLADFGQRNVRRVVLERAGGTFRAQSDELLFPDPPPDFRPVGLHETADGRGFYICDWQHLDNKQQITVGRLWRLTAGAATNAAPTPAWYIPLAMGRSVPVRTEDLLTGLGHPRKLVRLTAQRELSAQGLAAKPHLKRVLVDANRPRLARYHALWALHALDRGGSVRDEVLRLASGQDAGLARQALRQLGQSGGMGAVPIVESRLRDPDPSIRFAAATALGRLADPASVGPLLQALLAPETELWPRFAQFTALHRLGQAHSGSWQEIVDALRTQNAPARAVVALALRDTYDSRLADALITLLLDTLVAAEAREDALRLLRAQHRQPPAWKGEWWAYHPFQLSPPAHTVDWEASSRITLAFRSLLGAREDPLRIAGIEAVAEAQDQGALSALRTLWKSNPTNSVQIALVKALGQLGDAQFAGSVAGLLLDRTQSEELRRAALGALPQLWPTSPAAQVALEAALLTMLEPGENPALQLEAVSMTARVESTNALPQLRDLARFGQPALRESAVHALGAYSNAVTVGLLMELALESPLETRRESLLALGRLRERAALPLLLLAARDAETREAAWRGLASMPSLAALEPYLEAMNQPEAVVRDRARKAFKEIRFEALPHLEKRATPLSAVVRAELRRAYEDEPEVLNCPFLAAGRDEGKTAEDYARHAAVTNGDPWRGQKIFFDETRVACVRCHAVHGWGGALGPEMTTAGAQFARPALIEAILYPSKAVREGYQQLELELKSGESISGILKTEAATQLVLVDAEGRTRTLEPSQVLERRSSTLSIMPEGLQNALSLDEFTDLVAYLESLKADPRKAAPTLPATGWEKLFTNSNALVPAGSAAQPASSGWPSDALMAPAAGGRPLWSERPLGDGVLRLGWRWAGLPRLIPRSVPESGGQPTRGDAGTLRTEPVVDGGEARLLVRGANGLLVMLTCGPEGSGALKAAVDGAQPALVSPRLRADRPVGQWNIMELKLEGERVSVRLNGVEVVPPTLFNGLAREGAVGIQTISGQAELKGLSWRAQNGQ